MHELQTIMSLAEKYATPDYHHSISNQLVKLTEELGEAAQAYIGATGQNPRKGVTHTYTDLMHELIDVVITGWVALATVYGGHANNPTDVEGFREFVHARIHAVYARATENDHV